MSSTPKKIKIVSWNVNGLRAIVRKGDFAKMFDMDADIYCLQETKAEIEQLDDATKNPADFDSFIHASTERKGHAGTGLYIKKEFSIHECETSSQQITTSSYLNSHHDSNSKYPILKEIVMGLPDPHVHHDNQGRVMTAHFDGFTLINCYFPNGGSATSSLDYKLEFYESFLNYINTLRSEGRKLIIAGDWNIAHTEIDIARPKENANHIGFLPIERAWLDRYEAEGWIDAWRNFNPDARDVYTWWDVKTRSRDRNIGWRIDYIFVDEALLKNVSRVEILGDIYGSDHCPMMMEIEI